MKNFRLFRVLALFMVMGMTIPAFAGPGTDEPTTKEAARAQQLMERLKEIKTLAKQDLSRTEKKDLRLEVKEIRTELKNQNGIYLSVGAIIIILLVLILLL